MTQKFLSGFLMISKKNFSPCLAFFACQKKLIKIAIMCKRSKNRNFWHLEGNTSPVNYLRFIVHMFFNRQSHLVQCNKKNISLKAYINAQKAQIFRNSTLCGDNAKYCRERGQP